MRVRALLPDAQGLRCDSVEFSDSTVTIVVSSKQNCANCPSCGIRSKRVHSHYWRSLKDLPWHGLEVRVRWRSRRFFCDRRDCSQKIFVERVPDVAESYARRTGRLITALRCIAFACGGEGGNRLADRLGMPTSADTLLRDIRRTPLGKPLVPRVLGVDDWAFRRGRNYGTILVDHERRCPVDLLPGRKAELLHEWLVANPGVEVITRDRADYYIKGATSGAPKAVQVADRWHLLLNLREAFVRFLDRHPKEVASAWHAVVTDHDKVAGPSKRTPITTDDSKARSQSDQLTAIRRSKRLQRYRCVMRLHKNGVAIRSIAKQLRMSRKTVRRFVNSGTFPERAASHRQTEIDWHLSYLQRRWNEGCHNASELTQELKDQGFKGSYDMVRRRITGWRKPAPSLIKSGSLAANSRPSSQRVSFLFFRELSKLDERDRELAQRLRRGNTPIKDAVALVTQFIKIVRDRSPRSLSRWVRRANQPQVAQELQRFARGIKSDYKAVRAAVTLPWSNGPTEGHVNRLKLIKRQMFGRANFDLLRQRVLNAA